MMSMNLELEAVAAIQSKGEVTFDHGQLDGVMRYWGKPIDAEKVIQLAAEKGLTVYKKCTYSNASLVGESFDISKTTLTTTKFKTALDAEFEEIFKTKK